MEKQKTKRKEIKEEASHKGTKARRSAKEQGEMSVEEKLALLSETEKAYICGYIDRAVLGQMRNEK
jgi:hypothetical protein